MALTQGEEEMGSLPETAETPQAAARRRLMGVVAGDREEGFKATEPPPAELSAREKNFRALGRVLGVRMSGQGGVQLGETAQIVADRFAVSDTPEELRRELEEIGQGGGVLASSIPATDRERRARALDSPKLRKAMQRLGRRPT